MKNEIYKDYTRKSLRAISTDSFFTLLVSQYLRATSTDQYAQMHTKYSQPTENKHFNSEQTLQKKKKKEKKRKRQMRKKMGGAIQGGEDS